jgi:arylsulfatase A-like enzyme
MNETKKQTNVIIVILDGVRFDRAKRFPNFKKLFDKGTLFSHMITYAPYTIASLYSVFTGAYGSENGVNNYYGSLNYKQKEFKTLTEYLREEGYFTFGDLINDVVTPRQGFNKLVLQGEDYNCLQEHQKMLREARKIDDAGKNFFLFLHYSPVHNNLVKNVIKKYTDFDEKYFGNQEDNLRDYDSYIFATDEYLKSISEEIERLELTKNTLVVFFADHGSSVGEKIGERVYGSFCYDYTLKIFSHFIFPGIFPTKEVMKLTRGVDIMPTILDVLGIDGQFSNKVEGKSLVPLITGTEKTARIAFSETGGLFGPHPSPKKPNVKAIRTQNWKLIYNLTPKIKELYNLKEDPQEKNNLAGQGLPEEKELWELLRKKIQIEWIPQNI